MKDKSSDRPLISFVMCAYQQERFIREAVEAALAQTYSSLEIILSDDCSTDRTFEIMRELVENYQGPHQVLLNRNTTNLGFARHANRVLELCHGELLVGAAGDDVSLPERTETVYRAWEFSGRRAFLIQSNFIAIDEAGCPLDEFADYTANYFAGPAEFTEQRPALESFVVTLEPNMIGCAIASNPVIYSVFGPLPENLIHEDDIIALRAMCLGSLVFISIPLVKRRFHGNNLYSRRHKLASTWDAVGQQEDRMILDAKNRRVQYDAFLTDLQTARARKLISDEQWARARNNCLHRRRFFEYQAQYGTASTARKFQILFSLRHARPSWPLIKWMLLRLMPAPLFRSLKVMCNSARLALRTISPN